MHKTPLLRIKAQVAKLLAPASCKRCTNGPQMFMTWDLNFYPVWTSILPQNTRPFSQIRVIAQNHPTFTWHGVSKNFPASKNYENRNIWQAKTDMQYSSQPLSESSRKVWTRGRSQMLERGAEAQSKLSITRRMDPSSKRSSLDWTHLVYNWISFQPRNLWWCACWGRSSWCWCLQRNHKVFRDMSLATKDRARSLENIINLS